MVIIYALLLFMLMIIPHEVGHLLVAKAVGVQVNEFAFGMGPVLFKKQGKETQYSVRLLPLGGFCAMEGENEESDNPRAFNNKPWLSKIAVLLAGAAMNVITAWIIMVAMVLMLGAASTTIDSVEKGSPADIAGIEAGDKIVSIDGVKTDEWSDVLQHIRDSKEEIEITALSHNHKSESEPGKDYKSVKITPVKRDGVKIVGIKSKLVRSPIKAITIGTSATYEMGKAMVVSFKGLITGSFSFKDVSGPVGIVSIVGQTSKMGLSHVMGLIALISLNLAFINLLPLPALDGGRILFVFIRKITGKMISDRVEGYVHMAGMAILLCLAVLVTYNDIWRLVK